MRTLAILAFLVIPVMALSQEGQKTISPLDEAMQNRIISCTGESLNWQTQAITEKRRADELQKQIDALKKPPATPVK